MRYICVLAISAICGCATVSSSLQYTKGTEALEQGDYEHAATLLEEAVRLEPNLSRNHNNLASALFELGHIEEGWPHARKAVLLDPGNRFASENCRRYVVAMLKMSDLNVGSSKTEVVGALGPADDIRQIAECTWYQYGSSALCFEGERFARIGDMRLE